MSGQRKIDTWVDVDTGPDLTESANEVALNRHLMRLLLCYPGSPAFDREESLLIQAILNTGWLSPPAALEACGYLLPRWRCGHVYSLDRRVLLWARWHANTRSGFVPESHTNSHDPGAGNPGSIAALREVAAQFLAVEQPLQRSLFIAWVESNDRPGWKSEFATRVSRRPAWVTVQLGGLEMRLWENHEIKNADAFVAALRHFGFGPPVDTSETPMPQETARADQQSQGDTLEETQSFHSRLIQALRTNESWHSFLDLYSESASWQDVIAAFPDWSHTLDAMHQRFLELYDEWEQCVDLQHFYGRVANGRNNLPRALNEVPLPLAAEFVKLARDVAECARIGVAFEDAPNKLGVPQEKLLNTLRRCREVFLAWQRGQRHKAGSMTPQESDR